MAPTVSTDIIRSAPYFPVPDVAAIANYYRDVFGFGVEYAAGDPLEFAVCSRGGCAIMFRRVPDPALISPNERQGGTWDVFFWVRDVESLYEELSSKAAVIVDAPVIQPYNMKEFAVRDPNGYVLGFGQDWSEQSGGAGGGE